MSEMAKATVPDDVWEALHNARGAYRALRAAGLASALPGLERCERKLEQALANVREVGR